MEQKSITYKIKGMNKDLSYSAFNPEYSYDNKNVRITVVDDNDLLRITNERGNKMLLFEDPALPVVEFDGPSFDYWDSTSPKVAANVTIESPSVITDKGFVWSNSPGPTLESDNKISLGPGAGKFSYRIIGLAYDNYYYVRAYAVSDGVVVYTDELDEYGTIRTPWIPSVSTMDVTNITVNGFTCGGFDLQLNGGIIDSFFKRKIIVSKSPSPSPSDIEISTTDPIGDPPSTSFICNASGLDANTIYYVRARVEANVIFDGVTERFFVSGEYKTFKTGSYILAKLSTPVLSEHTSSTIKASSVASDYFGDLISCGFLLSEKQDFSTYTQHIATTADSFNKVINFGANNKKYYVRAYAHNAAGVAYSDIVEFQAFTPTLTSGGTYDITATSAKYSFILTNIGSANVSKIGVVYGIGPNLSLSLDGLGQIVITDGDATGFKQLDWAGTGLYATTIESLDIEQDYYVRAFAMNSYGFGYSSVTQFQTRDGRPDAVGQFSYEVINSNSIRLYGNFTDDGYEITYRGFICSQYPNVDITNYEFRSEHDIGGSGSFEVIISGLTYGKNYYFNGYATNINGTSYYLYEQPITIKLKPQPEFQLRQVERSTSDPTTVYVYSNIISTQGKATTYGVVWSNTVSDPVRGIPYCNDIVNVNTNGFYGNYTSLIKGASDSYVYIRAYGMNDVGITYTDTYVLSPWSLSILSVDNITETSITTTSVVYGGVEIPSVAERGIAFSTDQNNVSVLTGKATSGSGYGSYVTVVSGLSNNTNYYIRPYVKTGTGVYIYGVIKKITTSTPSTIPLVTTRIVTDITQNSAKSGGEITQSIYAIIDKGVCWGEDSNVSLSNNIGYASSGSGSESFIIMMNPLIINRTYFVRAYAKNSLNEVGYGGAIMFKVETLPLVTTGDVAYASWIDDESAILLLNNISALASPATQCGLIYMREDNYQYLGANDSKIKDGLIYNNKSYATLPTNGIGDFNGYMYGLNPNYAYRVRAFAVNSKGFSYGDVIKLEKLI